MAWSKERKAKFRATMAAKQANGNGHGQPPALPAVTELPRHSVSVPVIVSVRAGSQMTITVGQTAVTVVATP